MSTSRAAPAVLFAIALAVPAATAAWGIQGAVEPDTPYDVGTFNHLEPDMSPDAAVRKVYFNAIATTATLGSSVNGGGPGVNQNQLPGMRLAPAGGVQVMAFLGVWKDCDGDGFVGKAATALWSYRLELLPTTSACAPGTPWVVEGWVHEFVWITDNDAVRPLAYILDPMAKVWGDFGKPGAAENVGCRPHPAPRGTVATGGTLVGHADCVLGRRIAAALESADPDGSRGLAFDDPERPGSDCDHALNEVRVFGAPGCEGERAGTWEAGERRAFTVWDCDRPATSAMVPAVPEVTEPGPRVVVYAPAPSVDDPRGSFYEGARNAIAVPDCSTGLARLTQPSAWGPIVGLENAQGDHLRGVKRDADIPTDFWGTNYANNTVVSSAAVGVNVMCRNVLCPKDVVAQYDRLRQTPEHGGVHEPQHATGQGGGWRGMVVHRAPTYSGNGVRTDLTPAAPVWLTFYARLGAATTATATVPGGTGVYGAEACQGATTGEHDGWDCEASNWWRPDLGGRAPPPGWAPRPGIEYRLRDVDCLDGDLFGAARASVAGLAEDARCPTA